jgi:hypothetical protein
MRREWMLVLGASDTVTWRQKLDDLRGIIANARLHRGYDYGEERGQTESEEGTPSREAVQDDDGE